MVHLAFELAYPFNSVVSCSRNLLSPSYMSGVIWAEMGGVYGIQSEYIQAMKRRYIASTPKSPPEDLALL